MKKTNKILMVASVFVFLTASIFGETLYKGKANKNIFVMEDNHTYGDNFQIQNDAAIVFPKEYSAKKGDKVTIHIEGTVDKEIVYGEEQGRSLDFVLVDGSAKANYWLELTDRIAVENAIKPGENLVWDYTFVINKDAASKSGDNGCRFTIGTSKDQKVPVTLKTKVFTYIIER